MRAIDSATAAESHGTRVRRSRTSAETPSAARRSAASRLRCTVAPHVTMVRSVPGRTVAARPKGTT